MKYFGLRRRAIPSLCGPDGVPCFESRNKSELTRVRTTYARFGLQCDRKG